MEVHMKIAAFNVENLFNRPRVFDPKNANVATKIIDAAAELSKLFEEETYTPDMKARMLKLMAVLGILKSDESEFVWLRRIRGGLIKRPRSSGKPSIIANGRGDWIGWIEHKTIQVNEIAIQNTGRVIRDVAADIMAVVEAENRITLKMFSEAILAHVNEEAGTDVKFAEVMLIDGNDDRGIDVGVMTRNSHHVVSVASHIHDRDAAGLAIFSRDCPVYEIATAKGNTLHVLPNHFKSKFGGDSPEAKARRKAQATRVAEIYAELKAAGAINIVVLGDLNDTPDSDALKPLLDATDMKDVSMHESFDTGVFSGKGTFDLGNDNNKIDYILLSPALFAKVKASGLFRMGAYPGASRRWPVYPSLTKKIHAASDHHLIWADLDV
jgi:endonuclease/exonuclease/phosphatase family metal-dependent hydrolase